MANIKNIKKLNTSRFDNIRSMMNVPQATKTATRPSAPINTESLESLVTKIVRKLLAGKLSRGARGGKGDKGIDGKDADIARIIAEVSKKMPKPKDGTHGNHGSPDTAKDIAKKLNTLKEAISITVIKGLEAELERRLNKHLGGGGGGGDTIRYADLTSQLNGERKTFTLTRTQRVLGVFGTQWPRNTRPDVDWTFDTTTGILTLTDEVAAPSAGQTLWIMYVES